MTIKIKEGKFYKTSDGRKVGPMYGRTYGGFYDRSKTITHQAWNEDGSFFSPNCPSDFDLVSEWVDKVTWPQPGYKYPQEVLDIGMKFAGDIAEVLNKHFPNGLPEPEEDEGYYEDGDE